MGWRKAPSPSARLPHGRRGDELADVAPGAGPDADDDVSRRVWFVDLVLGAWRPREAAAQLALALGVSLKRLPEDEPKQEILAHLRGMIDVEASGEPTVMRAYDDAARIAAELSAVSIVAMLAPRYGLPLRLENEWFFFFLRRMGVAIAAVGETPRFSIGNVLFEHRRIAEPDLPSRPWLPVEQLQLLRFFPGLLPRRIAGAAKINVADAELIPAGPEHFLIPLIYRDRDPAATARDLDALANLEAEDEGLRAFCQTFCTGYFADSPGLAELARRRFGSGTVDLAASLAERARVVARSPQDAALADLRRQEILLAGRKYRDVATAPPPSLQAPQDLRDKLARLRTAGEVLGGEVAGAEGALEPLIARLRAEQPVGPDELLLLSALAEARVGKGDVGGGYFLAEAVDAALGRDSDCDYRLLFRNTMVLAGIHRLRADTADHRAALERAYATSRGARTFHELLELSALLAGTEANPKSIAARHHWLRAALAWLATDPTESLSRRAVEIVLGRSAGDRAHYDLDVSDALADALDATWPHLPVGERQHVPMIRAAGPKDLSPQRMLAGPGAGILWTRSGDVVAVFGRSRQRLIRLVLAALAVVAPPLTAITDGTLLIDSNLGTDIPRTREEALSVALRNRAAEFTFGMETVVLDDTLRPRTAGDLRLALAPLVQRIVAEGDRRVVRFRRHLGERTLTPDEAKIVDDIAGNAAMTLTAFAGSRGESMEQAEATLRRLEADRVIRLDMLPR